MSDLGIYLDLFIAMIAFSVWGSKGYLKYGLGIVLLILISLRLLLMFDIHMGKTLSIEDLKEQYPDLYYKMYATDEEKLEYFGTKANEKITELLRKSIKTDIHIFIEEYPDTIVTIVNIIFYVTFAVLLYFALKRYLL